MFLFQKSKWILLLRISNLNYCSMHIKKKGQFLRKSSRYKHLNSARRTYFISLFTRCLNGTCSLYISLTDTSDPWNQQTVPFFCSSTSWGGCSRNEIDMVTNTSIELSRGLKSRSAYACTVWSALAALDDASFVSILARSYACMTNVNVKLN